MLEGAPPFFTMPRPRKILGIDFYSGFRKNVQGGVQFEIVNKKIQAWTFIVASGKPLKGGGGANLNPEKVAPRNLKIWIRHCER